MQDGTAQLRIRRLSNFAANGLPVGFEYFTINKNIRTGSLPLLGGLYSRELYADLWSWVQEQPGYLISETEWQQKFQANNGNVPFYSSGDGTTTFRVPSLKCWVKSGSEITEVGSYLEAGLPNITGSYPVTEGFNTQSAGALYRDGTITGASGVDNNGSILRIDASRVNSIYGKSEEVTPESIVGLYCVIAFSTISNTGNLDVQSIYNEFLELKEEFNSANVMPTGTIIALLDDEVPGGYLPAEGAEISRTTYADLFNIIGTKFGEGDGSTTFNLPNLVGRFLEGDGVPGTLKEPGLPNITGSVQQMSNNYYNNANGAFTLGYYSDRGYYANESGSGSGGKLNFDASLSNAIYGRARTVQPKSITVKYAIKY